MPSVQWSWRFSLVAFVALLPACSDAPDYGPVVPVRGKVTWQGQPAAGALVVFHPLNATANTATKPNAETAADGTFRLGTYQTGDGAPPGKYGVTISWPAPGKPLEGPGPDRLGGRYSNPQQPEWTVEVKDVPLNLEPYALK